MTPGSPSPRTTRRRMKTRRGWGWAAARRRKRKRRKSFLPLDSDLPRPSLNLDKMNEKIMNGCMDQMVTRAIV